MRPVALLVVSFGRNLSHVFEFCASVQNADEAVRLLRDNASSRHLLQAIFEFVPGSEAAAIFTEIHELVSSEHQVTDDSMPTSIADHQASHASMFAAHMETIFASQRDALWEAITAVRQLDPSLPDEDCGVVTLEGYQRRNIKLAAYRWGAWRSPNCVLVLRHVPEPDGASLFGLLDFGGETDLSPGSLHFTHAELIGRRREFAGAPFWFLGGGYSVAQTMAEAWLQFTDGAPRSLFDVARHIASA